MWGVGGERWWRRTKVKPACAPPTPPTSRQLHHLPPTRTTLIRTVLPPHSHPTLSVQPLYAGLLRVTGTAADGTRAFVRDGHIEGEAPELPHIDIEI